MYFTQYCSEIKSAAQWIKVDALNRTPLDPSSQNGLKATGTELSRPLWPFYVVNHRLFVEINLLHGLLMYFWNNLGLHVTVTRRTAQTAKMSFEHISEWNFNCVYILFRCAVKPKNGPFHLQSGTISSHSNPAFTTNLQGPIPRPSIILLRANGFSNSG